MNNKIFESLTRASNLLGVPVDNKNYTLIKIKPTHTSCCCFHCWPKTWIAINEYISPCGPIRDEGDVLVSNNNERFVIECHESGPEIILYGVVSGVLSNLIAKLIILFLKNIYQENKNPGLLKLTKQRYIKGQVEEMKIMEIILPLSDEITDKLNSNIKKALNKKEK